MTKDRLPALKAAQNAEDSDDTAYVAINMEDNSRFMSDFFLLISIHYVQI